MKNENGEWIMHGLDQSDPGCIHSVDELTKIINRYGFLPLFQNEIGGFSVEEMTDPGCWWCGDAEVDPWEWRAVIARTGKIAYGKFFGKKAGFVSKKWFPVLANYRRDGYDFDARYEDGKAGHRENLIMQLFLPKNTELMDVDPKHPERSTEHTALFSFEVKTMAGFGKGGEKNFEGTVTKLQMDTYLVVKDFQQKRNRKGEPYGWANAIYTLPEYLWGYEYLTRGYAETPEASCRKIVRQILKFFPDADEKLIRHVV